PYGVVVGDFGAVVVFRSPSGGGYGTSLPAAWTAYWEWPPAARR
ncbi:hypothetical protein ABIE18_004470, partial [Arthrobacter sp. 2762]